jgi:hypothetical protein
MMKRLILSLGLMGLITTVSAVSEIPSPPSLSGVKNAIKKKEFECKVPPFLWNIPPQMVKDYRECVQIKFKPSPMKVKVVLKQKISKKAEFVSIKPANEFFDKVYEITYKIGPKVKKMICNHTMTYCLDKKVIVSTKK